MSWPWTYRASSKGVYDDAYGLLLEQTVPRLPKDALACIKNNGRLALTFQSSDRDLKAEGRTGLESKREQGLVATVNSRPARRLCELNQGLNGPETTKKSGSLFRSEHNKPSHGSRANPPAVLAVEHRNRTARGPSKFTYTPSSAVTRFHLHCPNGTAIASLNPKYKPLDDNSKASSGDDACLAVAAREKFQDQMIRMPAEICQMIMDIVFEEAFGPRSVHPHKDSPVMSIFLALNKASYRKYHEQYWTKNTWIISKGPLNKTMRFMTEKPYNETTTEFSLQTPNKAALQIKSIELSFSKTDTPDLSEWQQLAKQNSNPYLLGSRFGPFANKRHEEIEVLQIAQQNTARMKRAQRCNEIQHQLIHTWQDKFDRIAMLNLKHLTLDFTEAYDPDGLYLGVYLVPRLIPFASGMPDDFRILAPDCWIENQIRDAFLVLNAG